MFLLLQLRAVWYVVECAAAQNTDIGSGLVQLCCFKDATVFDYDKVYDKMADLYSHCFPVKMLASHLCSPPKIISRVIQPIVHSFMSKELRARTLTHDVPESEILGVLSQYGILREMLPTAMGGAIELDQSDWIVNRWALELEEI